MSLESQVLSSVATENPGFVFGNLWFILKIGFIILFILYFAFSLIVVRQVQLMTDTLVTEVSPYLRGLTILHAGIALAIIVIFIGLF